MLPSTIVVVIGREALRVVYGGERPSWPWIAALAAALVATIVLSAWGSRHLRKEAPSPDPPPVDKNAGQPAPDAS